MHPIKTHARDGGSIVHPQLKLGYIGIPKCASSATHDYLTRLGGWFSIATTPQTTAAEPFRDYLDLQLFTVVRHPLTWIQSGYRMLKQRYNYHLDFDSHVDHLLARTNPIRSEIFRWHCLILPDEHLENYKVKVFRVEQLDNLPKWLSKRFPQTKDQTIPVGNATKKETILEIEPHTLEKIREFAGAYAEKFGYQL